ncbi:MAG: hypothetical protein ACI4PY_04745 [Akkermansia muciniphila]
MRLSFLAACLAAMLSPLQASIMNGGLEDLQNYIDLAYNMGSFQPGTALTFQYNGAFGKGTVKAPVADFGFASDVSACSLIDTQLVATAAHIYQTGVTRTFCNNLPDVFKSQALQYKVISVVSSSNSSTKDYTVGRLSKVVTDATPVHAATVAEAKAIYEQGLLVATRMGCGEQKMVDASGNITYVSSGWNYLTGGVFLIRSQDTFGDGSVEYEADTDKGYYNLLNRYAPGDGMMNQTVQTGDSGSGLLVWNNATQSYMLMGVASWLLTDSKNATAGSGFSYDASLTEQQMTAYTDTIELTTDVTWAADGTLTAGETKVGETKGLAAGTKAWKDIAYDSDAWYAWDTETYQKASDAALAATRDVKFVSTANRSIELTGDVDMGIGRVILSGNGVTYTISGTYSLESAGYEVEAGCTLITTLTGALGREWRKVGAGDWHIQGTGDNDACLNIGGSGKTYLERTGGYAAYKVLINGGTTLVLGGENQVAKDITFGNGGGTLDLNGRRLIIGGDLSVQAFTQEARITNTADAVSTLSYISSADSLFLGSLNGNLAVEHSGSGTLSLAGTDNKVNSLTVNGGSVQLVGSMANAAVREGNAVHIQADERAGYAATVMQAQTVSVKDGASLQIGDYAVLTAGSITLEGSASIQTNGNLVKDASVNTGAAGLTLKVASPTKLLLGSTEQSTETNTGTLTDVIMTNDALIGTSSNAKASHIAIDTDGSLTISNLAFENGCTVATDGTVLIIPRAEQLTLSEGNTVCTLDLGDLSLSAGSITLKLDVLDSLEGIEVGNEITIQLKSGMTAGHWSIDHFGNIYSASGTGAITFTVPEPSTLFWLIFPALALRRRRRCR